MSRTLRAFVVGALLFGGQSAVADDDLRGWEAAEGSLSFVTSADFRGIGVTASGLRAAERYFPAGLGVDLGVRRIERHHARARQTLPLPVPRVDGGGCCCRAMLALVVAIHRGQTGGSRQVPAR